MKMGGWMRHDLWMINRLYSNYYSISTSTQKENNISQWKKSFDDNEYRRYQLPMSFLVKLNDSKLWRSLSPLHHKHSQLLSAAVWYSPWILRPEEEGSYRNIWNVGYTSKPRQSGHYDWFIFYLNPVLDDFEWDVLSFGFLRTYSDTIPKTTKRYFCP
jgi:hypothetical protein